MDKDYRSVGAKASIRRVVRKDENCVPNYITKQDEMSKYDALWKYIDKSGEQSIKLSFAEIKNIAGIELDHSFLNYKKELLQYGYKVGKISLKEKTVEFQRLTGN